MPHTPNAHLLFQQSPAAAGDLVFGASGEPTGPTIATGALSATFPASAPTASGSAGSLFTGALSAAFPAAAPSASAAAQYLSLTARPTVARAAARHQVAAQIDAGTQSAQQISARLPVYTQAAFQAAQPTPTGVHHTSPGSIAPVPIEIKAPQQTTTPAQTSASLPSQSTTRQRQGGGYPYGAARKTQRRTGFAHQNATRITRGGRYEHQDARRLGQQRSSPFQPATPFFRAWQGPFQRTQPPPPGRRVIPIPQPERCYDPALPAQLVFATLANPLLPAQLVFVCTKNGMPVGPPAPLPGQIVVPIRRVYMTVNNLSLTRVQGSVPMPATAFAMSLDADSWTWSWSATCAGPALDLLAPGSGNPVEMEAEINGVKYRLFAEEVSRSRSFGAHTVQVSGRGLAAELDKPYAPTLNFSSAIDRTAQQLATDALTINGVGIGWAVDWQLTDWLVPGGVWAQQGAYIDAVLAIARAAGGYVQPHRTAKTLRVLHRYPAPPWEWAGLAPDIVLPSAPVITEGIRWSGKPAYNRVFVAGETGGVIGQITRAGTAGNTVAPMVVDSLITHADAARQRGRAELSNTGQQAAVTLSLPVLPETGLIVPGQLVRYTDGPTTRTGLVRGTSLQWQRPKLRQTIELETHL